jgi:hypothetical protein
LKALATDPLPEGVAHTKAQHHKSSFALRAATMLHGGVDPGLLDEVRWWRRDDLWYRSLEALVTHVRTAATAQLTRSSRSIVGLATAAGSPWAMPWILDGLAS